EQQGVKTRPIDCGEEHVGDVAPTYGGLLGAARRASRGRSPDLRRIRRCGAESASEAWPRRTADPAARREEQVGGEAPTYGGSCGAGQRARPRPAARRA